MEVIYLFGLSLLITFGILGAVTLTGWGILKFLFPHLYFWLKLTFKH